MPILDADGNAGNGLQSRVALKLTKLSGKVGSPGENFAGDDCIDPCGNDPWVLFANCI